MKLITEQIHNVGVEKNLSGYYYISGPFIQTGIVNGNNRRYIYEWVKPEVDRYIDKYVNENRALGELNHPPTPEVNLALASHMIISLQEDAVNSAKGEVNWNGKAKVLNTPNGKIVQALLGDGVKIAVSTRALGSLKEVNGINEVQNDFNLRTAADIVFEPSAPSAFVEGVLEGKEWTLDGQGLLREMLIDDFKKELKTKSAKEIKENLVVTFNKYLRSL